MFTDSSTFESFFQYTYLISRTSKHSETIPSYGNHSVSSKEPSPCDTGKYSKMKHVVYHVLNPFELGLLLNCLVDDGHVRFKLH